MRTIVVSVLVSLLVLPAFAADEPKTEEQKTFYAIGLVAARQLSVFGLSPSDSEFVQQGFIDELNGKKPIVEADAYNQKIQDLASVRRAVQGEKLASAAKDILEKSAKEPGAVKTDSGLIYLSLKEGNGASPTVTDKVKLNYRGTLVDGKEFDSSYKRGQPSEFPLNGVIRCWTEALQKMKPGGKAKLVCPAATAYGERGSNGSIPPNATLIFEVELLEVKK